MQVAKDAILGNSELIETEQQQLQPSDLAPSTPEKPIQS